MSLYKVGAILILTYFVFTGCSMFDKLKEKLSTKKDIPEIKEVTKESTSGKEDLRFYNKYIDAMNKIQEAGEGINKNYASSIPEPASISKNSLIIPVTFSLAVQTMERTLKEYKRSFLDGGELSKLSASKEMQTEIEADFRNLLSSMESYYNTAEKVSKYYSAGEFKNDLSKAKPYDEEMKGAYEKYKSDFRKFSGDLKKYKPKREVIDPTTISNPDQRSARVMLNAYGNILDAAETFYESFESLDYKSDMTQAKESFGRFKADYDKNKNDVLNSEFTEKTKFMKYSFEDYFANMADKFIESGNRFFEKGPGSKNGGEYRKLYNDLIDKYNSMITAYNTSIQNISYFQ